MKELADINFLEDGLLRERLVAWSLAIVVAGSLLGIVLLLFGCFDEAAEFALFDALAVPGGLLWLVVLVVTSAVALPAHELVHAAFFRLFGGRGTHVTFGFSQGMLYAGCPGLVLPRRQFVIVLLAPAVLLGSALLAVPAALGLPLLGYAAFVLHLSGCVGDLLAAATILRTGGCTHVEDTASGVRLLG